MTINHNYNYLLYTIYNLSQILKSDRTSTITVNNFAWTSVCPCQFLNFWGDAGLTQGHCQLGGLVNGKSMNICWKLGSWTTPRTVNAPMAMEDADVW